MRIVRICPVSPPDAAPVGVRIRELAEDLTAAGHNAEEAYRRWYARDVSVAKYVQTIERVLC